MVMRKHKSKEAKQDKWEHSKRNARLPEEELGRLQQMNFKELVIKMLSLFAECSVHLASRVTCSIEHLAAAECA